MTFGSSCVVDAHAISIHLNVKFCAVVSNTIWQQDFKLYSALKSLLQIC